MVLSLFSMISFPVTLISGKFMDGVKQHHVAAVISMIELTALLVCFSQILYQWQLFLLSYMGQ